jgi:hypothetical protein
MASLFMKSISPLSAGLRSGATFVGALGAAGLLAQFTHAPPIFLALVASLVAAGMAFMSVAQDPFDTDHSSFSQINAHLVSFLAAMVGLWGIANIVPDVTNSPELRILKGGLQAKISTDTTGRGLVTGRQAGLYANIIRRSANSPVRKGSAPRIPPTTSPDQEGTWLTNTPVGATTSTPTPTRIR